MIASVLGHPSWHPRHSHETQSPANCTSCSSLVADTKKAFLVIAVKEEDRDILPFPWVNDLNSAEPKIVEYKFAWVVFGVTSSPFLLNATLLEHITSYERENPEFVSQMLCSLYVHVDDLSLSLVDEDKAYQLYLKSRENGSRWI